MIQRTRPWANKNSWTSLFSMGFHKRLTTLEFMTTKGQWRCLWVCLSWVSHVIRTVHVLLFWVILSQILTSSKSVGDESLWAVLAVDTRAKINLQIMLLSHHQKCKHVQATTYFNKIQTSNFKSSWIVSNRIYLAKVFSCWIWHRQMIYSQHQ